MNTMELYIGSMLLLGSLHTVLLVYLKLTGKSPELYAELGIKKWLVFMMALTGFLIGFFLSNSFSADEHIRMIAVILGFTIGVPLFIVGVGSLKVLAAYISSKFG